MEGQTPTGSCPALSLSVIVLLISVPVVFGNVRQGRDAEGFGHEGLTVTFSESFQDSFRPSRCNWCSSKMDGLHSDELSNPPCSGYFECKDQQLFALHECPLGQFFSPGLSTCGIFKEPPCYSGAANKTSSGRPDTLNGAVEVDVGRRASRKLLINEWDTATAANATIHLMEINALLAFKSRVKDPYGALASWTIKRNRKTDICQKWSHIKCTPSKRVQIIYLGPGGNGRPWLLAAQPNYSQSIPPVWGNLSSLSWLSLTSNLLTGPIPEELFNCPLEVLDLSDNAFSGNIPIEILKLKPKLMKLFLDNNYKPNVNGSGLSGAMPYFLGNLSALEILTLANNKFTGQLPPQFGQLSELIFLQVGFDYTYGNLPPEWGNLMNLSILQVSHANITGPIPTAWNRLSGLAKYGTLILSDMPLGIKFPTDFFAAICSPSGGNNMDIDLGHLNLSGSIPWKTLANCNPEIISITGNPLTGGIDPVIASMNSLQSIDISYNQLSGSLPKEICLAPSNGVLSLSGNQFTGGIPTSCDCSNAVNASQLNFLFLDSNKLSGEIPPSLAGCGDFLHGLNLSQNDLDGNLASLLPSFHNLSYLLLASNKFSGPLVLNSSSLYAVDVHSNYFSGPFPPTIRSLKVLTYLDLSNNQFSGPLPSWIGELINLQYLNLSNNNFNGSIPSSIWKLKKLKVIDLSDNHFTGLHASDVLGLEFVNLLRSRLKDGVAAALARRNVRQGSRVRDKQATGDKQGRRRLLSEGLDGVRDLLLGSSPHSLKVPPLH